MISVIIPTYNRAVTLKRAMESVLSQDYTDIELLIVDDGSTDNTKEIVDSFSDQRVRYLYQKNSGACRARNYGIEEAKGEFIAFQDSDDEWYQGKLSSQMKFLEEQGVDMVYHIVDTIYEDGSKGRPVPRENPPMRTDRKQTVINMLTQGTVSTQTVLVKASEIKACPFDDRMPRLQEWEWSIRFAREHDVAFQEETLAVRYIQADSLSLASKKFPVALSIIFEKNIDLLKGDKALWKRWTSEVANYRFNFGLPARKVCLQAFLATGDFKFLAKSFLCLFGLEKKVGKNAN